MVRKTLEQFPDIDICDAAKTNNISALKTFIDQGCDVNSKIDDKYPLWSAADAGRLYACRFLIEHGADVNARTDTHRTALCAAVENHDRYIVSIILEHCTAGSEFESLEMAIELGYYVTADFLIDSGKFKHHDLNNTHCGISKILDFPDWGFPMLKDCYTPNWQNFLVDRLHRLDDMDPTYLHCALAVGAMTPEDRGLPLVDFPLRKTKVNINCNVRVIIAREYPLTDTAESGNPKVLRMLLDQPQIDKTVCGENGIWHSSISLFSLLPCLRRRPSQFCVSSRRGLPWRGTGSMENRGWTLTVCSNMLCSLWTRRLSGGQLRSCVVWLGPRSFLYWSEYMTG